jgi:hypothetical protein
MNGVKIFIWAYTFVLLAYTGWRTYDFMLQQLPKSDISYWLALLFLFATEAGMILWHVAATKSTSTYTQHYVSNILVWLDFVASLGAGTADMILRQTFLDGYVVHPLLGQALIYGLPLVVAANVAGALLYLSNDSDTQIDTQRRMIDFEIGHQALKQLSGNRRMIASRKRDELYNQIVDVPLKSTPVATKKDRVATKPGSVNGKFKKLMANPTLRRRQKD